MKKLSPSLLAVLLSVATSAQAADWRDLSVSSTEHKETTHIDYDSIQGQYFSSYNKSDYYIAAWIKKDYPTAQKLGNGKLYRQEKAFWQIDCNNRRYNIKEAYWYTSKGSLVASNSGYGFYMPSYSSADWERAVPDTVGAGIVDMACFYYNLKYFTFTS